MTNMFKPPAPAAPAPVTPPPTMPDNQSPEVLEAKRRAGQDAMARAGRNSTILSQSMRSTGTGAPPAYSATKTGAG